MQRIEIDDVMKSGDGSLSQFGWLGKAILRGSCLRCKLHDLKESVLNKIKGNRISHRGNSQWRIFQGKNSRQEKSYEI